VSQQVLRLLQPLGVTAALKQARYEANRAQR
jgi:hypothetical protein